MYKAHLTHAPGFTVPFMMSFAPLCCVLSAMNGLGARNVHVLRPGTTGDER